MTSGLEPAILLFCGRKGLFSNMSSNSILGRLLSRHDSWFCVMTEALPHFRLSFRVHFIRMSGHEMDPTVRVILVETTESKTIYEGFGTWRQCKGWIVRVSGCVILADQFAAVHKCLKLNRLATIHEVQASVDDLESVGFRRTGG